MASSQLMLLEPCLLLLLLLLKPPVYGLLCGASDSVDMLNMPELLLYKGVAAAQSAAGDLPTTFLICCWTSFAAVLCCSSVDQQTLL